MLIGKISVSDWHRFESPYRNSIDFFEIVSDKTPSIYIGCIYTEVVQNGTSIKDFIDYNNHYELSPSSFFETNNSVFSNLIIANIKQKRFVSIEEAIAYFNAFLLKLSNMKVFW
jgi:hypothetical protein